MKDLLRKEKLAMIKSPKAGTKVMDLMSDYKVKVIQISYYHPFALLAKNWFY